MRMVKNKLAPKLGVGFVLFVLVMSVFSGAVSATDRDTNSIDSGINITSVVQNESFAHSERSVADTIGKKPKKERDKISVLSFSRQTLSNGIIRMTLDNYGYSETFYYPDDGQSSHEHMHKYETYIRYNDSTQSFKSFSVKKPITLTRGYGYNYTNSIISDGNLDINITAILFDNKHYILFKYDLLNVTTYLRNVSIYQGADLDMEGTAGSEVGYYDSVNDILFENQTRNIGFGSDNQSVAHDLSRYGSMWSHIRSDTLNNDSMYPTSGTSDVGIALKWNLGNLSVATGKTMHIALAAADSYVVMAQNLQEALKKEFVSIGVSKGLYESEYTPGDYSGTVYDLTTLPEKQIKVVIKISNPTPDMFNVSLSDSFPDEFVFAEESNTTPNFSLKLTENKVCWNFTLEGNSNYAFTYYLTIDQPGDYWLGTAKLVERNEEFSFFSDNVQVHIIKLTKPDLAVNVITWSPDIICDGDQVAVNATIVNNGTDNAADFYVRFEVDGDYIGRKLISCLSVGANTRITQNWLACAGSHNITVYVDEYNVIEESDDTNNKMTADLPFIQFPDLTVTNISWTPTDIVGGDTVTFTATVTNIGAGSTSSDFYVRFEVDGKSIGHAKVSDGLDSGSSTEVTQSWTATWASTINASVDEDDAVVESEETNNRMSNNLPGLPFPDLIVTGLTWEPKENVNAGDPVTFTATIENTGGRFHSTMSKPLKIAFLINDEYVGSRNIVGGIRTGQPLNTTFTWLAQPGTNPEVCVVADHSNMIPESNENNNELCETVTLAIKSPDLTITQLTFEPTGSIHVGDTVIFRAKVANIGAGDYNGDFDIGFYVDDVYAGAIHVANGVPAGEAIFSTFNWIASSCSDPVIIAKADFFDNVQESDKGNNEKTEILPASVPYADLEITDINWSLGEDIKDRDPVIFNVTVKNRGSGTVITDFKVYFDIDGYFTRTNVISGGLAAGESKTTSFTWKATPGDGHNATAKADPDNVVPESDKANNERVQLLPFNVSLVEIFEVKVEPAEITTGIGGQTSCKLKINNYGSASGNFGINVSGLDFDWYMLSTTSLYLSAGQEGVIDLVITVPEACENSGTFPLQIAVTSQETGITKQGSANLIVEPTPIIHDLLPKDGAFLGSDDVTFYWDTYINATTKIYLKSEDETDYNSYTGAEGQIHTVIVSNLARNKNYSYYAESTSTCGTNPSSVRTFYIGKGICFTKDVYEFTVERDYNQRVTIGVRNTDNEYHELLVEVPTTYDDLVLGFVGAGSQDNIIPLNPGESKDITLAVHLQDAMNEEYEFMANLISTKGDETLTDTARIKIHVHVPRIDYNIEEIGVDGITLMKTFRLTNKGDPITDLTISPADNLKENAYIEPVIEHYRLGEGASVKFNVVPILSSPDFQPASPIPPVAGDIIVNAAGIEAKKQECFTVPEGKQPYKATVSSPGIINIGRVRTHHCNNNPNTKTAFDVHSDAKDNVRDDPLVIRFSSPGWEVKPHDLYISINGHEVGSLINTIPEGYYKFDVDPSFLIYPERGVAKNYIELHTVHQNGGHYLVSSDVEVRLNLENYETWVIASSQEEANQIAADNLPPGFYESPDSITIGEVEIASEAGDSAVFSALSATSQVYLGKPTTIQTTAEPHLDVDAMFDNGDGTVHLAEVSSGVYKGTWTPKNLGGANGKCLITIRAKGSGVKGEITQTVKINEPTKLYLTINEPEDGKEISLLEKLWNEIIGYFYGVQQPIKITITDDVGSEITPSNVIISGNVVITEEDGTKTEQQLTIWAFEGNGKFRYDWRPECPGDYEITVIAMDKRTSGDYETTIRAMDLSSSNRGRTEKKVTGTLKESELKLKIIYPGKNFEVLEYGLWKGGHRQKIRVKVTDKDGKGVTEAQVSAKITFPNDDPTFYPEDEYGVYYADWKPQLKGKEPYTCMIKVTAEKASGSYKTTVTELVTGTVDPVIDIIDIKPEGVYHQTGKGYTKLATGGLLNNAYDPLWDDNPVDPSDDDYVKFTYELNKDVDKVIITEYKDISGPCNEQIGAHSYTDKKYTSKGKHEYYMNVKDLDEDQYYIKVETCKKYDRGELPIYNERGSEDCARWEDRLHIARESFAQIYIEEVAIVSVGKFTEEEFKKSLEDKTTLWFTSKGWDNIQLAITIAMGFGHWQFWVPASLAAHFVNFDDLDTLGFVKETWHNNNLKKLDKAEVVRFTGRVYGWDGDKYRSGYPEHNARYWLNGEFIYSNLYREHYDNDGKPLEDEVEFLDHSPHDILAKKVKGQWHPVFYSHAGPEVIPTTTLPSPIPWLFFRSQRATFLNLNQFWGWGIGKKIPPHNDNYSKIYFREYVRYNFESKGGSTNPFHGQDTSNPPLGVAVIGPSESESSYRKLTVLNNPLGEKNIGAFGSIPDDATFSGLYADHGTDTDGDGLYDCLTLEVGLSVTTPGYYTLQGALANATGELVGMETKGAELPSGLQMLELDFNGMSIHQNEINGTYSLMYLDLYNENWDEMDSRSNFTQGIYTTAAYNYTEFQGPSISFTDIYSEETADTDSDGSYDYLTIEVEVEVNVGETGDYTIVGWLSGGGLRSIVQSQNSSQLNSGLHEIQLSFDGKIIGQKGIDGPYTLNLAAYDESFHILGHRCDAYTTAAYHGSDFQRIPAEFNDVYSDQGIDTNSDGLYDYLIIDVEVNVTKAGNYTLSGQLVDTIGIFVASADTETSLDVGTHTLHLNFDGQVIRRRGVDGAFNLSASLYKWDTLTLVDEMFNEYTTAVYSHMDFQAPPAEFTANFSDQGRDTDGDGLYNYLTVGVEVAASAPGHYTISGELFDSSGLHIRSTSSYISLDNGTQTVQLDFDGQTICEHCLNGPYNLTGLTLYDESGKQIDYQDIAYTTSLYNYIDFQTLPAEFNEMFSDHGTDTDGDGKYNYLTVEVEVTVATPGDYAITGRLNDCNGNYTVWSANHSFLDVGAQIVQLNFDGQTIRQHGVDGTYNLTYLEIYNADVRDIDRRNDVYTTSAYRYTDFEVPSVQFNDIFSDHGTDLDDDGLYDHLTVAVGVNVTEAGNYSIEGRLADNAGNFIVPAYNYTSLDAGSQTLQLNFEGPAIRKHGMDGPYNVIDLRLCDESGETIDSLSDAHTTFAYNYSQFEAYPVDLSLLESDIVFTPETPTDGETVNIAATIHNTGTDDVVSSVVVVQFFDGDPNAGGDQIGCDQTVSSILSGDVGSAQIYWTAIPGTHDIFVRVDPYNTIQEANENNNQAHKPITIEPTYDQLPIASFTYSRLNPAANETIMFNATNSYDPDGFIVNYEWDFGDDIAAAGEIVEHSYSKPGDYIVILRVTDNASVSNTNTMILTITMVETAVCGDVTGDINVTMADARRIVMWLSYPEDYPIHNPWAADVTGDGTVTMADARRIVMWLSYPYQYPLTCSLP